MSSWLDRAADVLPGGVNSPVRAFRGVGGDPFFVARGSGSRLWDTDGNEYIDYVLSWGPLLYGHAHPRIIEAVTETARLGTSFGATTPLEIELAELVRELVPSMEQLRFVSSGTEATMSAIRLARGFTGREMILKFEGCYHGHGDSFLVKAGSGVATLGLPNSPGVPADLSRLTLTAPLNDLEAVHQIFQQHGSRIAAVIVEPIAGNAGMIPPLPEFLPGLRSVTEEHGALLIFDEVMTGFRVAAGGAQELFGVIPDLTTLGKVVGGGMPVGAFGGRREIMEHMAPVGPVYQAGTLSGNPVAMAAGLAQLQMIQEAPPYRELEQRAQTLVDGLLGHASNLGIAAHGTAIGAMWGLFFTEAPVTSFADAQTADLELFRRFYHGCLSRGIFFAPSAFEAGFLSTAHTDDDVQQTIDRAGEAMREAVG